MGSSCFYAAVTIHQQKLMTVKNNNQDTEEESSKANVQEDECAVSYVRLLSYRASRSAAEPSISCLSTCLIKLRKLKETSSSLVVYHAGVADILKHDRNY